MDLRRERWATGAPTGAALLLVIHLLAACGHRAPLRGGVDERQEGRELYLRACASCHGTDARGAGPAAASLRVPPPDLTRLAAGHGGRFPRQYIIDVVVGIRDSRADREMPVWNDRFASGPGNVASFYARRHAELLADYLATMQRD